LEILLKQFLIEIGISAAASTAVKSLVGALYFSDHSG